MNLKETKVMCNENNYITKKQQHREGERLYIFGTNDLKLFKRKPSAKKTTT